MCAARYAIYAPVPELEENHNIWECGVVVCRVCVCVGVTGMGRYR